MIILKKKAWNIVLGVGYLVGVVALAVYLY